MDATSYIRQAIDKSMEIEPIAHSRKVHHDKLIALANILHYQAGVEEDEFSSVIDSPSRKLKANEAKNIENAIQHHQDKLINWAKEESIAKDVNYIAKRAGLGNDVFATRYIKGVVTAIYQAVLSDDSASLQHAVNSLYTQINLTTGKPIISEDDADKIYNDTFGFKRGKVPQANLAEYFKTKIADNILNTIELAYAKQSSVQHDINLLPMTTGDEILYRGIPAFANDREDISADSLRNGISHARIGLDANNKFNRKIFDFGIRSKWWHVDEQTRAQSTTAYLPVAIHYATKIDETKKNKFNVTGFIYKIYPRKQTDAVSAGQYNAPGGKHVEITLSNIDSSCIKERVKIERLSNTKYRVIAVEPNKFFDKSLETATRKDTELKRGDILKDGAVFQRRTKALQKLNNDFTSKIKNLLSKGAKLDKRYIVEHQGKTSEYNGTEQNELYDNQYRKSKILQDPERHTSKRKPKYEKNILDKFLIGKPGRKHHSYLSKDFKKHYTQELLQNYRSEYHNPTDNNSTELAKDFYSAFDVLQPINRTDLLPSAIAVMKEVSADMASLPQRAITQSETLTENHNKIANTLFSNSYKNLNKDDQEAVHKLTQIAVKLSDVTASKIEHNNANIDLKKGVYGGIGAEGELTTHTVGCAQHSGFLLSKIYDNSPAQHKGLKAGTLITAIGNENVAGMTLDQFVTKMRGKSGERVTIKFIDSNGKQDSTILTREVIDAAYQEKYKPTSHVKAEEAAKKQLIFTFDPMETAVRAEYTNRAINGVKYYVPNSPTPLDDLTKQNIRMAKQSFKQMVVKQTLDQRMVP
jgi:hypothetical protein